VLTRGYLIGEIVDDLAALGAQVRMGNAIHMFDLTVTTENFFRDVLSILLQGSFRNLNSQRSNEPGLDLGDDALKIGVQVTSTADGAKVVHTLEKITPAQAKKYQRIVVLGLNKRQRSYKIDPALAAKYNFSADADIWDLDTLARKTIDLEFGPLQALYNLVRSNSARLKIELEVPDADGNFPSSGYDYWEKPPVAKIGDGTRFQKFMEDVADPPELPKIQAAILELSNELSRLPRVTREFLAMLFEQREPGRSARFRDEWQHLLLSKVKRLYRGDDLEGELDILVHANFVSIDGSEPHERGAAEIGVRIPSSLEDLNLGFVEFIDKEQLSFRSVLGSVDLSGF
jgi:hypothetical protein